MAEIDQPRSRNACASTSSPCVSMTGGSLRAGWRRNRQPRRGPTRVGGPSGPTRRSRVGSFGDHIWGDSKIADRRQLGAERGWQLLRRLLRDAPDRGSHSDRRHRTSSRCHRSYPRRHSIHRLDRCHGCQPRGPIDREGRSDRHHRLDRQHRLAGITRSYWCGSIGVSQEPSQATQASQEAKVQEVGLATRSLSATRAS